MITRDQAFDRMSEIYERLKTIADKPKMTRNDDREFEQLHGEFEQLRNFVDRSEQLAEITGAARGEGNFRIEGGTLGGYDPGRAADTRAGGRHPGAMRQLERSVKAGLPARSAETVERLLGAGTELENGWVARWVTDTGSDAYRSAFSKLVMFGESRAGLEFTAEERAAYDRVARLASEQRAMSLTDSSGGFLVPYELDPTVVLVSGGSTNPLLEIANVKTVTTDVWHGVTSAGVQFSWDAEASEVSDDSPTLAEPEVPNYKLQGFVPFSVELQGDAVNLVGELGKLLNDGATQILNQALTVGSGTGQPTGLITALAGSSAVLNTATPGTLTPADIYSTQNSLAARWQPNARWISNLTVANAIRQEETGNGALKFPSMQGNPPTLLGRPTHEASFMDNTIAAGKNLMIYGDFSNYVVTQRVGTTVELVPHIFGPNGRPRGQRGMVMWQRVGADSINDSAFRMLAA